MKGFKAEYYDESFEGFGGRFLNGYSRVLKLEDDGFGWHIDLPGEGAMSEHVSILSRIGVPKPRWFARQALRLKRLEWYQEPSRTLEVPFFANDEWLIVGLDGLMKSEIDDVIFKYSGGCTHFYFVSKHGTLRQLFPGKEYENLYTKFLLAQGWQESDARRAAQQSRQEASKKYEAEWGNDMKWVSDYSGGSYLGVGETYTEVRRIGG